MSNTKLERKHTPQAFKGFWVVLLGLNLKPTFGMGADVTGISL